MKVKIFVNVGEDRGKTLKAAIEKVLTTLLERVEMVESAQKAHLIIATEKVQIGSGYDPEKFYAVMTLGPKETETENAKAPANVRYIFFSEFVKDVIVYICEIEEKVKAEAVEDVEVELLPDAKSILVVEDTLRHRKSAAKLLAGHKLTIAKGYEEAMEIMAGNKFDVVLTDLYMPMSPKTLGQTAFELGKVVPYGLLLVLEAARNGAKFVAVATDLGHHDDYMAAAFDHYGRFDFKIEKAKVRFFHCPMTSIDGEQESVKDWKAVLERITGK